MTKLNWGILGTGQIARAFAKELPLSQSGTLHAVGSRSQDSADVFAQAHGATNAYASYNGVLDDPDVEAIYISLPNHLHAEWTVRCAEAGKHILCEKPFTTNHAEAMTAIEAARRNDVFLMEAFMYRCHPQTQKVVDLVRSGALGEVRLIEASFGYSMGGYREHTRLTNEWAGGGLLDVGCYAVSMSRLIAGAALGQPFADPVVESDGYKKEMAIKAFAKIGEQSGVDEWTAATVKFPGDILAQLTAAVQVRPGNAVRVWGSEGSLIVRNPWLPDSDRYGGPYDTVIELRRSGQEMETLSVRSERPLFALEADNVAAHIEQRQSPAMSWADTLGNMATLDAWRREIGLAFENEKVEALGTPTSGQSLARRPEHNMRYGRIEGIDKPVSRLVLGTMIFKADRLPLTCSMLDYFYETGGNCLDTAHVYRSEKAVGQWLRLRNVRDEMVIIGKGARDEHGTPEGLTAQLIETLETMQTDYLDLYLMHTDRVETPVGELVDCLNEHLRAGRIRAFGGSNWSIERIEAANTYAHEHGLTGFAASSPNLSLASWNEPMWPGCLTASGARSRAWYASQQMPLLAWSSQATGFFTGRYAPEDRDTPSMEPIVRTWFNDGNWQRLERAQQLAAQKDVTAAQIALAYVLTQSFPTFALIGPQTIDELRTALPALDVDLSEAERRWLNLESETLAE